MNTLLLKKELATMMMFVPIVAVGAAALGLTVSSVRNMAQTFQVAKAAAPPFSTWVPPATPHEAVSQLESMKRKELLELFLSFKAPSNLSDIEGEWNGCLLENNGWILVRTKKMSMCHYAMTLSSLTTQFHVNMLTTDNSDSLFDECDLWKRPQVERKGLSSE